MISETILRSTYDSARYGAMLASDQEVSFYKIGSLDKGKSIRNKLSYLDLYTMTAQELLLFYDQGLDYTDYEITDDQVRGLIDNINELLYNLFS